MKVAEKDNVVHGMLEDEFRRSQEVVQALQAKLKNIPRAPSMCAGKKLKIKIFYSLPCRRDEGKIS